MVSIVKKCSDMPLLKENQILFLLLVSGICGFLVGAGLYPDWQVSVEAGQVIAGTVQYPSHTIPQYIYLVKTWTLLSQISAFLLWIGLSEAGVSILIAGIIGALSFQALAVLFFSVSRNILLSLLIPFFICFMSYVGWGVVYPILFMESPHSFGRIGLVFVLLIVGVWNAGYFKTGSFLLGLAPAVHPSWGSYGVMAVAVTGFIFYRNQLAGKYKTIATYFSCGLCITLISFFYQYSLMKGFPSLGYQEKITYITSFIKHWDYHRIPFNYLSPGFIIGAAGTLVSILYIRSKKIDNDQSFFIFRLMIVSFFLASFLSVITYFPPKIFPTLHILMPGRYINLNNIIFVPVLLGILAARNSTPADKLVFSAFVLGALGIKIMLPHATITLPQLPVHVYYNTPKDIQSMAKFVFTMVLPLAVIISLVRPALFQNIFKINNKATVFLYKGSMVALLFLSAVMVSRAVTFNTDKLNVTDPVLKTASARSGMLLLSTDEPFPVHMALRRPTPIDPGALDGFLSAPESGPQLNDILGKIYGLNILVPPLKEGSVERNSGTIPCVYKKLWEERSVALWRDIKKEFGVTDILTLPDWHLQLPVVARGNAYILYAIPDSLL
jgi:hypothetical protein